MGVSEGFHVGRGHGGGGVKRKGAKGGGSTGLWLLGGWGCHCVDWWGSE